MKFGTRPCGVCGEPVTKNALGRESHMRKHERERFERFVRENDIRVGDAFVAKDGARFPVVAIIAAAVKTEATGGHRYFRSLPWGFTIEKGGRDA